MGPNELTLKEKKSAIMNVVAMMLADKVIKPEELRILHVVAKRVGVTKEEVADIIKNRKNVEFVVPRSMEERVYQLLDMIIMMSIDHDFDELEKTLCTKFALAMGFNPLKVSEIIAKAERGIREGRSREDITIHINV